ncbi:hypothetical protein GCM10022389_28170 [Flavobacterium cheonanense]|uniref:Uncharacterized protein n=1 Tax=Flavobacterium cheonanense TaxID=706183 RepID=A0ABP7W3Q3_9FLAO
MNNIAILSIKHFTAFNQVVEDYKSLLFYEQELINYEDDKRKASYERVKKEIIFLLKRIIKNKDILEENTKADQEYLNKLIGQ